jgi:hypothetical protein
MPTNLYVRPGKVDVGTKELLTAATCKRKFKLFEHIFSA